MQVRRIVKAATARRALAGLSGEVAAHWLRHSQRRSDDPQKRRFKIPQVT
jgi:hypothetical protein